MRNHGRVTGLEGHADGLHGLGDRADLIQLDENRVGHALRNAFGQDTGIGDEDIVSHELDFLPQFLRQNLPAGPISFRHAILDRDERIAGGQELIIFDQLLRGFLRFFLCLEFIGTIFIEFTGGRIEGDKNIFSRLVAGGLDGLHENLHGFFMGLQAGREATLIANGGIEALGFQHFLEMVKSLGPHAQGFPERRRSSGNDHEFLDIQIVVRMSPTIEHVHHRHRQYVGRCSSQVAIQGQIRFGSGGSGGCHAYGKNGVRSQPALAVGPVKLDQKAIQTHLIGPVPANDLGSNDLIDILNRLEHSFPEISRGVPVAQLERFPRPR